MASLCPFKINKFCNDGFPSEHADVKGVYHCAAWVEPNDINKVCSSGNCGVIVPFAEDELFNFQLCDSTGECPYYGCRRLRKIEGIPLKTLAKIIQNRG